MIAGVAVGEGRIGGYEDTFALPPPSHGNIAGDEDVTIGLICGRNYPEEIM